MPSRVNTADVRQLESVDARSLYMNSSSDDFVWPDQLEILHAPHRLMPCSSLASPRMR